MNHLISYHLYEVITVDNYGYRNLLLSIGLKISYFRKFRGYTQEELAERAGVSTTFIGMVEAPNLYKAPSLKTLYAIATALDVPMYKLLQTD